MNVRNKITARIQGGLTNTKTLASILSAKHPYIYFMPDRFLQVTEEVQGQMEGRLCSLKSQVTVNEQFFIGHLPDMATMPGGLMIEALAQTALLGISALPGEPRVKKAFLTKIKNVCFKQPIIPGDTVYLQMKFKRPKAPFFPAMGTAKVNKQIAVQCELTSLFIFEK